MFKTNNYSKPDKKNFGVGSIIIEHTRETYLVIPYNENSVRLLSLTTMEPSVKVVSVLDVHHLTQDEARKLVELIEGNNAFSDLTFKPEGFKFYKGDY